MRRIEADRPTTDEWWVRVSMWLFVLSLPRLEAVWAWPSVVLLVAGEAIKRFSVPGRGSQSYLVGRCSDLLSLLGVHLDAIEDGVVPPACQLSCPGRATNKTTNRRARHAESHGST